MSSLERKIQRNKIKAELKRTGQKQTAPLSKYRFKTQKELQEEYAEKLTEQMLQQAKESTDREQLKSEIAKEFDLGDSNDKSVNSDK